MAFTIQDALQETGEEYKMRLLAGKKGNNRKISWVHVIEDTTIIRNFWGNELAITLGIDIHSEEDWIKIIDLLIDHRSCGLIVNTGDYINEVPTRIIDYCDNHDFPLLTVPWQIYVADMVKDYCMRILLGEQDDILFAKAFQNAIRSPLNVEDYKPTLQTAFDVDGAFQVVLLYMEANGRQDLIYIKKAEQRIKLLLEKVQYPNSFFQNENYFVLIVNYISDEELQEVLKNLLQEYELQTEDFSIIMGIGQEVVGVEKIVDSYIRAKAATRKAYYSHEKIVSFKNMGVDQLLFTSENEEILFSFYKDTLKVLIDYDKKHNSYYEDTLEQYIACNGSINQIADNMFTHRNTVSYRISKIKELLNCSLETPKDRFPYQMAFYIKNCFSKILE